MALRCIEALREEHREITSALLDLEALIDEFLTTDEVPPESLEALAGLAGFLRRELILHLQKEDRVLFPALGRVLARDGGPLAVLSGQHELIADSCRGLLEGLAHLNCCPSSSGFGAAHVRDHGRALIEELRAHLAQEERILFPLAEARIGDDDDRRILQESEALVDAIARSQTHA